MYCHAFVKSVRSGGFYCSWKHVEKGIPPTRGKGDLPEPKQSWLKSFQNNDLGHKSALNQKCKLTPQDPINSKHVSTQHICFATLRSSGIWILK